LQNPATIQPRDAASLGISGCEAMEGTNDVITNGELVSGGALGNVDGKKNMERQDAGNGQDLIDGRPVRLSCRLFIRSLILWYV